MRRILILVAGVLQAVTALAQLPNENELQGIFAQNLALAKTGNTQAEAAVCAAYSYGIGTAPDQVQAFAYCSRAADAGDPGARLLVADFHLLGIVTKVDVAAAKRWYQHAIDDGLLQGHVGLAQIYFDLDKVWDTRDLDLAAEHAKKAADAELLMGEMYMGIMYFYGMEPNISLEADIDYEKAAYWFEKSAQQGGLVAAAYLVNIYNSQATQRNPRKAYLWAKLLKKYQPDTYPKDIYFQLESRMTTGQRSAADDELLRMERRWEKAADAVLSGR